MKISKGTIIRTALLVLAFINSGLALAGKSPLPIADEDLKTIINYGFTLVTAFVAWWKNNSLTTDAIKADEFLSNLRKRG